MVFMYIFPLACDILLEKIAHFILVNDCNDTLATVCRSAELHSLNGGAVIGDDHQMDTLVDSEATLMQRIHIDNIQHAIEKCCTNSQ